MYLTPHGAKYSEGAANGPNSAPEAGAPETKIAQTLYRLLRANSSALVQGEPGAGDLTLIDGNFDLLNIVHDLMNLEHLVKAE